MTTPAHALTLQFLAWVAAQPRTYQDAMEAWRTSCPRLSIWEDAIGEGLVAMQPRPGRTMQQALVVLTPRGAVLLRSEDAPARPPAPAQRASKRLQPAD